MHAPETSEQCRALRTWAEALPVEYVPTATDSEIIDALITLAVLPKRSSGEDEGRMGTTVYVALLREFSLPALEFMAMEAVRTLKWYPVPAECIALAKSYRVAMSEREIALRQCAGYEAGAFDRWLAAVAVGRSINRGPDQWRRVAVERGILRCLDREAGVFVTRALYHGPVKVWSGE